MKKTICFFLMFMLIFGMTAPAFGSSDQRTLFKQTNRNNILRADFPVNEHLYDGNATVLGSDIPRTCVRRVFFMDTLENASADAWDASEKGDGSVMAWVIPDGDMFDLYIGAEGGIRANANSAGLFWNYYNVEEIHFGGSFNTLYAEDMYGMFVNCMALKALDLRRINTENVRDMNYMFFNCSSLELIALGNDFRTPPDTDYDNMLYACPADLRYDYEGELQVPTAIPESTAPESAAPESAAPESTPSPTEEPELPTGSRIMRSEFITSVEQKRPQDFVLGHQIQRDKIRTINFTSSLRSAPDEAWDVSALSDGSVMAWVMPSAENANWYDLYIGAIGGVILNENCASLFADYQNLTAIYFNDACDASHVRNAASMFSGCKKLTSLNLPSFDTQNLNDVRWMFYGCSSLQTLDLSSFTLGDPWDVRWMLSGCSSLYNLIIDADCTAMGTLSLHEEGAAVEQLQQALVELGYIESVSGIYDDATVHALDRLYSWLYDNDASRPDGRYADLTIQFLIFTAYVPLSSEIPEAEAPLEGYVLRECTYQNLLTGNPFGLSRSSIGSIVFTRNLSSMHENQWDVSAEQNGHIMAGVEQMDNGLYALYIDTDGIILFPENSAYLFASFTALESIDFGGVCDTSQAVNMTSMFYGCPALTELDLSCFDTANVTDMSSMFYGCSALTELNITSFNTQNVRKMSSMFRRCASLNALDLSSFDTQNLHDAERMFDDCPAEAQIQFLESIRPVENLLKIGDPLLGNPLGLKFSSIRSIIFQDTFSGINDQAWDVSDDGSGRVMAWVKPISEESYTLFIGADGPIIFSWNSSGLFNGSSNGFPNVTEIHFGGICDTSRVQYMDVMFKNCRSLTHLDISSFDMQSIVNMSEMFSHCLNLRSVSMPYIDPNTDVDMHNMFMLCSSLEEVILSTDSGQVILTGTLKRGDKGDTVRQLQQKLIDAGYLSGSADGSFGPGTQAALERFSADVFGTASRSADIALQFELFTFY